MKFTLSWLKDFLDTDASAPQIAERLTALGLEVEEVIDRAAVLAPFTVAKILTAEKHPQADKLKVCRVQSDAGELQIVCGAANARAGLTVALAKEGAIIPANGMKIKKSAIRGVESQGMLCSAEELGLAETSEGIIELPDSAKVGEKIADALGLNDPVFDIAITPNRADALGGYGIARDLAASGMGKLKPPNIPPVKGQYTPPIDVKIETEDCSRFVGFHFRNVKNGESPAWLKQRLTAIGSKPISALVDITNYFTFSFARPMHVFDADKLQGNIIVRRARAGEKLAALNGKEVALTPEMMVIADQSGPIALAGIIGGEKTGCTESTKNVVLEVAVFNPANIAATGRALQIESDARYRFERGVDAGFVKDGAALAAKMILELCSGEASELISAGKEAAKPASVSLSVARLREFGGLEVTAADAKKILESLGCTVSGSETLQVTPPSWRTDLAIEADLVEEVLRIRGYDSIPALQLPKPAAISKPVLNAGQRRIQMARHALAARGMHETQHWSFISHAQAELFGGQREALELANPISAELTIMRNSLLAGLAEAVARNTRRGYADLALFEVGPSFHGTGKDDQKMIAAGIRSGNINEQQYPDGKFQRKPRPIDCFDAKADALAVLAAYGLAADKIDITRDTPPWYHPGRSGKLTLGGKIVLGYFGELHPKIAMANDLKNTVLAGFEILLDAVPKPKQGRMRGVPSISDFQAVMRDFALVVNGDVAAANLLKAVAKAGGPLLQNVSLFDVYSGKGVEEGKKSVALQVTLQAADRTLTDEEIQAASQNIVETLKAEFGAALRA